MFIEISKADYMRHPFLRTSFLLEKEKDLRMLIASGIPTVMVNPKYSKMPIPKSLPSVDASFKAPVMADAPSPGTSSRAELEALWGKKKSSLESLKRRRKMQREIASARIAMYYRTEETEKMILAGATPDDIAQLRDANWREFREFFETLSLEGESVVVSLLNDSTSAIPYHHGLNTAVLCAMTAKGFGEPWNRIQTVMEAALLHDIGYYVMQREARTWVPRPRLPILKERQKHILEAVQLLSNIGIFSEEVLQLIHDHHERPDGKGYWGLKEGEIGMLLQYLIVASYYDRRVNNRIAQFRLTPHEAIMDLYNNSDRIPQEGLKKFVQTIGVFPPGSVVELSDSTIGLVMSTDKQNLRNPEILIYDAHLPPDQALPLKVSDLGRDVTIVAGVNPNKLKKEIREYLNVPKMLHYTMRM